MQTILTMSMGRKWLQSRGPGYVAATLSVTVVTAVCTLLRTHINEMTVAAHYRRRAAFRERCKLHRNFDLSCSEVVSGVRDSPLGHKMERDMRRICSSLVFTGLVGGLCSFASAATMTMTGMISDSACGASHAKMMDRS